MRIPVVLPVGLVLALSSPAALAEVEAPVRVAQAAEQPGAEPEPAAEPSDLDGTSVPVQDENDADQLEYEAAEESGKSTTRGGIEEIVVQAGESDSVADFEAGDSVTGFDASDLEALGAQSVEDIASFTPNLEIVTSGATTPTFFIRGVGLNDFNANSSGAVAVYQDDVPKNAPALQLQTLFDMEAVNVLRGPQGTGPYRNASAGAIKLYSRRPTGGFNGFLRSSLGNYSSKDFEGAIEAPIYEDILASRFAFRFLERDGYATNRCGGAPPEVDFANLRTADQLTRGVRPRSLNQDAYIGDELIVPRGSPGSAFDPEWSICGEPVDATRVRTNIPPYGAAKPQIQGNGLTDPDNPIKGLGVSEVPGGLPTAINNTNNWAARGTLRFRPTLDMDWLLTAQGSRRDELSRLGQSYGTRGQSYVPGCFDNLPEAQRPPECVIRGTLGGPDAGDYQTPEVVALLSQLNPCANGEQSCTTPVQRQNGANTARLAISKMLAEELDPEPYKGDFNRVGPTQNDVWSLALRGEIALGNTLTLSTVSGYDTYDRLIDIDLDMSPTKLFETTTKDEGWQFAQDLHLAGGISEDLPLRWEIGAFYLMENLKVHIDNTFRPEVAASAAAARDYTQKLWSVGPYASFVWDFANDFTLDGGVRYNWENKTIDYALDNGGFILTSFQDTVWQAPTGTLRLTYRFRENTHAYWKYTRGWKGGHYNATSSPKGVTSAQPETIDAFEGGLRGSWFEGMLGLDASVFYYLYNNYQIFTAEQQFRGQPEFVILNANDAEVYGSEVDLVARPWPGAFMQARFSWLESQFLDFVQKQTIQAGSIGVTIIREIEIQNSGNRLLNSPQFKLSLTGEQTLPLGRFGSLTARYDGAWTDTTFYDATGGRGVPNAAGDQFLPETTIGQQPFWLHNLRLAYRTPDGAVEVAGWVRNLTGQVYKTFAFDGSTFNQTTIYFVGEPRTYGLTVTTTF